MRLRILRFNSDASHASHQPYTASAGKIFNTIKKKNRKMCLAKGILCVQPTAVDLDKLDIIIWQKL